MKADGYAWWIARLKITLERLDLVRVDHFRGFESYWAVPADSPTAVEGEWVKGPGIEFFEAIRQALGALPLIAEDLGHITDEVVALRDAAGLPGMKVLQFAFDGNPDNPYLPYNVVADSVIYTGTHDNDTTVGWFTNAPSMTSSGCALTSTAAGQNSGRRSSAWPTRRRRASRSFPCRISWPSAANTG